MNRSRKSEVNEEHQEWNWWEAEAKKLEESVKDEASKMVEVETWIMDKLN